MKIKRGKEECSAERRQTADSGDFTAIFIRINFSSLRRFAKSSFRRLFF
jgi:hypothetical protein